MNEKEREDDPEKGVKEMMIEKEGRRFLFKYVLNMNDSHEETIECSNKDEMWVKKFMKN